MRSSVDDNFSATLFSLVPELGFDSSHAAVIVGVPYYRTFATNVSSGGLGDVYVSGFLRGRAAGFDFGSALTAGAPTGDRTKGFGAGKVTIDATGTAARPKRGNAATSVSWSGMEIRQGRSLHSRRKKRSTFW